MGPRPVWTEIIQSNATERTGRAGASGAEGPEASEQQAPQLPVQAQEDRVAAQADRAGVDQEPTPTRTLHRMAQIVRMSA